MIEHTTYCIEYSFTYCIHQYCIYSTFLADLSIARVAKLRLASRMLIHFKLGYQGAWPPLVYSLLFPSLIFILMIQIINSPYIIKYYIYIQKGLKISTKSDFQPYLSSRKRQSYAGCYDTD